MSICDLMLRNLIENYGWLPITLLSSFIAYKYLGFNVSLSAGISLASMFLGFSLLRVRLRKKDPRRFMFGLVAGFSILLLVAVVYLGYVEMKQYLVIVVLIPAFIIDYFLSKKYSDLYD